MFALIYRYLTRDFNFWSQMGVKGPKPVIGFGTFIYEIIRDKPDLEVEWIRKYGKIYGYLYICIYLFVFICSFF